MAMGWGLLTSVGGQLPDGRRFLVRWVLEEPPFVRHVHRHPCDRVDEPVSAAAHRLQLPALQGVRGDARCFGHLDTGVQGTFSVSFPPLTSRQPPLVVDRRVT